MEENTEKKEKVDSENSEKRFSTAKLVQSLGIFAFVKPYKWSLIWGIILLFLSSLVFLIFPDLGGRMIDIAQGNSDLPYSLNQVGIFLLIILFLQSFVSYTRVLLFAKLSEKGTADVRRALYNKLMTLPVIFYENNKVGELISRLTADVEKLYNTFSITIAEFLRQVIILSVGIVYLAFKTPKLSLIMLSTFPVVVVGAFIFGRYIRKLSKKRQEALANTNDILSETLQSIFVVKAFTSEVIETVRYGGSIDKMVDIALKYAKGRAIFSVFIVFFLFGTLFFVIWMAAKMLERGELTAGSLVSFVIYTGIIGGSIASLGNFYTELIGSIGATERIRELLNKDGELVLGAAKNRIDLRGNIKVNNVTFAYPSRPDIEVLKNLNILIKEGQKVALVGASGAGKSTLAQLLLRFYDIQKGSIEIDGNSIYEPELVSYRNEIGIVPQEVILFGGSIRENIKYGNHNASEEEIIEAVHKSNSWEFISKFPEGMDTLVGERGVKLSGGQRQRIAIARALLKNPKILILDEATSALDAESEKVVQDALDILLQGRTSIIIAHRLATIKDVDKIFVFNDGEIIEEGTHAELSVKPHGAYNALAKLQFEIEEYKP